VMKYRAKEEQREEDGSDRERDGGGGGGGRERRRRVSPRRKAVGGMEKQHILVYVYGCLSVCLSISLYVIRLYTFYMYMHTGIHK